MKSPTSGSDDLVVNSRISSGASQGIDAAAPPLATTLPCIGFGLRLH